MLLRSLGILFCTLLLAAPASAATCGGDFNAFLSARFRMQTCRAVYVVGESLDDPSRTPTVHGSIRNCVDLCRDEKQSSSRVFLS
jgi:hypothetical protein